MDRKERVERQVAGEAVDRLPLMGGWFHGVANLAALAGVSTDAYLAHPAENLLRANEALGVDCMIEPIIPDRLDQVRTAETLDADFAGVEPEDIERESRAVPDSAAGVLRGLDVRAVEEKYRAYFLGRMRLFGDIVLIPNFWESVPDFHLYSVYGYRSYLEAVALYPEALGRLFWQDAVKARLRNEVILRLIRELDLPRMLFTGGDICNNRGPMCAPSFLREHYFPHERSALEPLLDGGIRVVRHCDGNVMPLLEDFLDVGYSGFQGFQYECGVDLPAIAALRSRRGERLLFFAGMNVTRTLPFGSVQDVRDEVDYVIAATGGGQGLFLFTSSSIGPEVPLANIRAAYGRVAGGGYRVAASRPAAAGWPGAAPA